MKRRSLLKGLAALAIVGPAVVDHVAEAAPVVVTLPAGVSVFEPDGVRPVIETDSARTESLDIWAQIRPEFEQAMARAKDQDVEAAFLGVTLDTVDVPDDELDMVALIDHWRRSPEALAFVARHAQRTLSRQYERDLSAGRDPLARYIDPAIEPLFPDGC